MVAVSSMCLDPYALNSHLGTGGELQSGPLYSASGIFEEMSTSGGRSSHLKGEVRLPVRFTPDDPTLRGET